jgi:hypothetical protein
MDNRCVVTRKLGGVPSKNHHGDLISTPPKKSAAQKFRPAGPIRATDTNRTTCINFSRYQQNATRLKALPRIDLPERILWVLRTQISACRACSPICAGYPQLVRVIQEKSREMLLFHDFIIWALKSLKKKTAEKLSTANSFTQLRLWNPPFWTDSGCPDKYMKTQCN